MKLIEYIAQTVDDKRWVCGYLVKTTGNFYYIFHNSCALKTFILNHKQHGFDCAAFGVFGEDSFDEVIPETISRRKENKE